MEKINRTLKCLYLRQRVYFLSDGAKLHGNKCFIASVYMLVNLSIVCVHTHCMFVIVALVCW